MTVRPKIADELEEYVRRLHREYTGNKAGKFEEALETVTQLAEQGAARETNLTDDWYPGKYLGMVVDSLVNERSTAPEPSTEVTSAGSVGAAVPIPQTTRPERTAVFKSYLQEGYTLSIPEAEVDAVDSSEGDLLQAIVYPIPKGSE